MIWPQPTYLSYVSMSVRMTHITQGRLQSAECGNLIDTKFGDRKSLSGLWFETEIQLFYCKIVLLLLLLQTIKGDCLEKQTNKFRSA